MPAPFGGASHDLEGYHWFSTLAAGYLCAADPACVRKEQAEVELGQICSIYAQIAPLGLQQFRTNRSPSFRYDSRHVRSGFSRRLHAAHRSWRHSRWNSWQLCIIAKSPALGVVVLYDRGQTSSDTDCFGVRSLKRVTALIETRVETIRNIFRGVFASASARTHANGRLRGLGVAGSRLNWRILRASNTIGFCLNLRIC